MRTLASIFTLAVTRLPMIVLLAIATIDVARADVFSNVPEALADEYQLVFTLPIQNMASYNLSEPVPYTVDNSASILGPFDRVAYYLELDDGSGLEYAYASMDAFTTNVSHLGLPIASLGAFFQRNVSNLNVVSNSSGVTTGTEITTGNVEFWSTNYAPDNSSGVPGASGSVYDYGDAPAGSDNYGSFQIHNYGAGETIIAYNQWGGYWPTANGDLGIGNAPTGNPDWTFAANASHSNI